MADADRCFRGRGIARGVAFGHAHIEGAPPRRRVQRPIAEEDVEAEIERLTTAIDQARRNLEEHVRVDHSPHDDDLHTIVAAHLMVLEDRHFIGGIENQIRRERVAAEQAVENAFSTTVTRLLQSRDAYLRSRAEDLRDISQTLCELLETGTDHTQSCGCSGPGAIYVSGHLHPSAVMRAQRCGAAAFVSTSRAYSSHGVMLLRAAGLPSVVGLDLPLEQVTEGTPILVDATRGEVFLRPGDELLRRTGTPSAIDEPTAPREPTDAVTADGTIIALWANIDNPGQIEAGLAHGLRGIGLLRTEYLALVEQAISSEQRQLEHYTDILQRMSGRPVTFRTFDLGGDKYVEGLQDGTGANPAMGARGIRRHLLRYPDELRCQLRALLRASVDWPISILLPLVTDIDDIKEVRRHLHEVQEQLTRDGVAFGKQVRIGAMIEVPAAALNVRQIFDHVDFIAIGTNDLIQYLSAADRDNVTVSNYLTPERSGLYPLLEGLFEAARSRGREDDVMVCGELASDPEAALRLVGLGARALTIVPRAADEIRHAIATLRLGRNGATE